MSKTYTIEEQKENREKWIEALRSGKYKQGLNYLCKNGKYCCLGVLCDISGEVYQEKNSVRVYDIAIGFVPKNVRNFVGLRTGLGNFFHAETETDIERADSLAILNDKGFTFEHIANVIESEPEGLFHD